MTYLCLNWWAVLELLIVSIIPFITWLIWSRKRSVSLTGLGWRKLKVSRRGDYYWPFWGLVYFSSFSIVVFSWFDSSQTATAAFLKGLGALPAILAYAILGLPCQKKSLEVSFEKATRKTRIPRCQSGSVSLIWPHPCTYVYPNNWLPKSYGYYGLYQSYSLHFWCYQWEKAGGSILPSVFIHALANTVVGLLLPFPRLDSYIEEKLSWMN